MKKLKHILILIILTVTLLGSVVAFKVSNAATETTNDTDFPKKMTLTRLKNYSSKIEFKQRGCMGYAISRNSTLETNYAYCVQKGAATYDKYGGWTGSSSTSHELKRVIRIKGNIAQWYDHNGYYTAEKQSRKVV